MARGLGRGRYVWGTYPEGAGGGSGGGAANVPLTRQRFIDGDTVQAGLNGSAAEPFKTIAQFIAARGNASVADATANFVGWLMPALNGYTENIAFPPYASTELRADSFSAAQGAVVTGNVTWPNVAGANTALEAVVVMHNVTVSGSFTVTDDAGAPQSSAFFGGDEAGNFSVELGGGFDSHTTTKLGEITFYNAIVVGGVNTGTTDTSANLLLFTSEVSGNISAKSIDSVSSFIASSTITLDATLGAAIFSNTKFSATSPVLDSQNGANFDGVSWQSFLEAGGTRSVAGTGTPVLVIGGYSGGQVDGAALPTGAGTTNVSLNGTGATAGYTGSNSGNHYTAALQTGDGVVHLLIGGGELFGDTLCITKADLTAHTLTVQNDAGTTLGVIPSGSRGFVIAQFNGAHWAFLEGGSLAA